MGHDELTALIRARLPADSAAELLSELNLTDRLASLVAWGTCEAWQDKATTEEEFLRNRYRYQLTEAGAALNQAVRAVERDLGPGVHRGPVGARCARRPTPGRSGRSGR